MPIRLRSKSVSAQKELRVLNRFGLHARPATEFVRHVQSFQSELFIVTPDGKRFHAGRIMDVLLANLDFGIVFMLEANGPDAEAAVNGIADLLKKLETFDDEAQ